MLYLSSAGSQRNQNAKHCDPCCGIFLVHYHQPLYTTCIKCKPFSQTPCCYMRFVTLVSISKIFLNPSLNGHCFLRRRATPASCTARRVTRRSRPSPPTANTCACPDDTSPRLTSRKIDLLLLFLCQHDGAHSWAYASPNLLHFARSSVFRIHNFPDCFYKGHNQQFLR